MTADLLMMEIFRRQNETVAQQVVLSVPGEKGEVGLVV